VSRFLHKSHNVSVLLYHFVCPTKYRRAVIGPEVDAALVAVCKEIADRYEIDFIEIGADPDHVHFFVQSVPTYSPSTIVRIVKSLTARELFVQLPWLRKALWGSAFWSSGFYVSTVGRYGSESTMRRYIAEQGLKDYQSLYEGQLALFDETDQA